MAYTSKREETSTYFWPSERQQNVLFETKQDENNDIFKRQIGYLYCVVCASQMDTERMWGNHIKGNRHYTNSQNFEYSDEEPFVQKELDRETRPISGLDHLYEIVRSDNRIFYQCLLCPAGLTSSKSLVKHMLSLKHQLAFLKEYDNEKFSIVNTSALTESEAEAIVEKILSKYEQKHGRGKMFVMKAKKRPGYYLSAYKKYYDANGNKRSSPISGSAFPPEKSFRYSSSKYARMEENSSESEWNSEGSREGRYEYLAKPYYSDAEIYKSIGPKSTLYRRASTHMEIEDSRLERDNFYNPAWPSRRKRGNCRDLRVFLEQKKNIGKTVNTTKANLDVPISDPFSSEINEDSDDLLRLVDDMSPEVFLRLVLFKLKKMDVKDGIQLKLLDCVANKAAALSLKVKKKILAPNLKAKYKESQAPNNVSTEDYSTMDISSQSNLQFAQKLDNLIGHYKSRKTTVSEGACIKESYSSQSKPSEQYIDNKPMSRHQLNDASHKQNTPEIEVIYDSGLNQEQSNT